MKTYRHGIIALILLVLLWGFQITNAGPHFNVNWWQVYFVISWYLFFPEGYRYFSGQSIRKIPRQKVTGHEEQAAIRGRSSIANNGMWGVPQLGTGDEDGRFVNWLISQLGWMIVIGFGPIVWLYIYWKTKNR